MGNQTKELLELFPDADESTQIIIPGLATRIRIDKGDTVQIANWEKGDGTSMLVAFIPRINRIIMRLDGPLLLSGAGVDAPASIE